MIKLIAIDIDGTLLTSDHRLTSEVTGAIKKARASGVTIILCTGRPLIGIAPYLDALELRSPRDLAITQNGALVQETLSEKILSHLVLTLNQLKRIQKATQDSRAQLTVLNEKVLYVLHPEPSERTRWDAQLLNMPLESIALSDFPEDFIMTKAMHLGTPEEIDGLLGMIPESFKDEFYMVRSVPYNYEFLHKQASKGNALKDVSDMLGLKQSEVMAIGDAENDRTMLACAGTAVVMANACDEIKLLADFVTRSNDEHGVAYAIEKLVLKG